VLGLMRLRRRPVETETDEQGVDAPTH
jgi:hypothetical protein